MPCGTTSRDRVAIIVRAWLQGRLHRDEQQHNRRGKVPRRYLPRTDDAHLPTARFDSQPKPMNTPTPIEHDKITAANSSAPWSFAAYRFKAAAQPRHRS